MTKKSQPEEVLIVDASGRDQNGSTVYSFPELGVAVAADDIEEATKLAKEKAKGNK